MPAKYLKYLLANIALTIAAILFLFIYLDPTGLLLGLGLKSTWGCSQRVNNDYDVKPVVLYISKPETIIVGTSRISVGIRSADIRKWNSSSSLYNLGTNGLTIKSLIKYLHIANYSTITKNAYIGLDTKMFLQKRDAMIRPGALDTINESNGSVSTASLLHGIVRKSALTNMFNMVANRDVREHSCNIKHEENDGVSPKNIISQDVTKLGYLAHARSYLKTVANGYAASFDSHVTVSENIRYAKLHVNKLKSALSPLCSKGVNFKMFFTPLHAELQKIQSEALPNFDIAVKTAITEMTAELAESGCNIELWDFAIVHPYTTGLFPDNKDPDDPFTYYWEPSHFKQELGSKVLSSIYGQDNTGFGVRLTIDNIKRHLERQAILIKDYQGQFGHDALVKH